MVAVSISKLNRGPGICFLQGGVTRPPFDPTSIQAQPLLESLHNELIPSHVPYISDITHGCGHGPH